MDLALGDLNVRVKASVVTLAGSPGAHSKSTALLARAEEMLAAAGVHSTRVNVRDLSPDTLIGGDHKDKTLQTALSAVCNADALIIATPIYKASYAGLLKVFLDLLPQDALRGTVVLPLASGGNLAHLLAMDYALNPVLRSLGAHHVLANVFATPNDIDSSEDLFTLSSHVTARLLDSVTSLTRLLDPVRDRRDLGVEGILVCDPCMTGYARASNSVRPA